MTTYTIIGYKCNGTDSVMGCVQDRVDSDFIIDFFDDAQYAAEHYAKLTMEPPHSKFMHHGWELTVLYDGKINEDFEVDADNDYCEIAENAEITENFQKLIKEEIQKIKDYRAAEKKRVAEEKRKESERAAEVAKKAKEKAERAKLEELKSKYEA